MSQKRVVGVIFLEKKRNRSEWHLPPQDKELGEKLGEIIAQTFHAYYKAKGIEGGAVETPNACMRLINKDYRTQKSYILSRLREIRGTRSIG